MQICGSLAGNWLRAWFVKKNKNWRWNRKDFAPKIILAEIVACPIIYVRTTVNRLACKVQKFFRIYNAFYKKGVTWKPIDSIQTFNGKSFRIVSCVDFYFMVKLAKIRIWGEKAFNHCFCWANLQRRTAVVILLIVTSFNKFLQRN